MGEKKECRSSRKDGIEGKRSFCTHPTRENFVNIANITVRKEVWKWGFSNTVGGTRTQNSLPGGQFVAIF